MISIKWIHKIIYFINRRNKSTILEVPKFNSLSLSYIILAQKKKMHESPPEPYVVI